MRQHFIIFALVILSAFSSSTFNNCSSDHLPTTPSKKPAALANVDNFGATANGKDDSEAFKKAWKVACFSENGVLLVPQNKVYRLKQIVFSGPCNHDTSVKILGTVIALNNLSDYTGYILDYTIVVLYWLMFDNIKNLKVGGRGTINGDGSLWWSQSCRINPSLPCKEAPMALVFNRISNMTLQGLMITNAQKMHVWIENSTTVDVRDLNISSPKESPNTDGIHVTSSQDVQIKSIHIIAGDDCISIENGCKDVHVENITCGPGHGISIGSLGKFNSNAQVSNVSVSKVRLFQTTNGARIKTWLGGSGHATNISFQNFEMYKVSNPILINQYYCAQVQPCPTTGSAVQLSNVVYKNIEGTSASKIAVNFNCSSSSSCQGIRLQNVHLVSDEGDTKASCVNVNTTEKGVVFPSCNGS